MKVLYVNHTAQVSGAEHSLLTLLAALPSDVRPLLACPAGELARSASALGISVAPLRGTAGSLRLHPLHTPRAVAELLLAARQLRALVRGTGAEVVHANSIRAAMMAALGVPPEAVRVAHIRDCLPPGRASALSMRLVCSRADLVIANSAYTAANVRSHAIARALVVAHNPVDPARFDRRSIDRVAARGRLGAVADGGLLLAVVAQISPWKGQMTAIEAIAGARERGHDARLLIVGEPLFTAGSTRYDNRAYAAALRRRVQELGIERQVAFLGRREDVPELMVASDGLLAPSWEEPFGRSIAEAMALAVPVLATAAGGPPELIEDGRDGRLLDPHDLASWVDAIAALALDRQAALAMGERARQRVARELTPELHAEQVAAHYRSALDARCTDGKRSPATVAAA